MFTLTHTFVRALVTSPIYDHSTDGIIGYYTYPIADFNTLQEACNYQASDYTQDWEFSYSLQLVTVYPDLTLVTRDLTYRDLFPHDDRDLSTYDIPF